MLGRRPLDVSLHAAAPAARHVSPSALRPVSGCSFAHLEASVESWPSHLCICWYGRAKGALMAEDVPKLEKLLKKGKNVTPQVIADRQVKVGSHSDA